MSGCNKSEISFFASARSSWSDAAVVKVLNGAVVSKLISHLYWLKLELGLSGDDKSAD
jgi:hypothetical protein